MSHTNRELYIVPTHSQVRGVLVEVVGGAPHDVQVAAAAARPGQPVVGGPGASVPGDKFRVNPSWRINVGGD